MKKTLLTLAMLAMCFVLKATDYVEVSTSETPYPMDPLKIWVSPDKDFSIVKYGAKPGDADANTKAFQKAMAACNKSGGGRVVVPSGEWLTGPIHFQSNCNLYLSEGAVLVFDDDPQRCLPAVQASWEGSECMNFSPMLYAFECENIAITGTGTLAPKMDLWRKWFERTDEHMQATRQLYAMCSTGIPVQHRHMEEGLGHMRPHLIHFNRCTNVQLADFNVKESPFWTIHLFMCREAWAHGLKVYAHGDNNDGIDIEMTQRIVVENCSFDQGDDAVVLKAGRNQDAWRLATPTQDVIVRNCEIVNGHCILGIGSEMSGGVQRVYMHDCKSSCNVYRMFYLKTNHRRGGFIRDITVENVEAKNAYTVFEIDMDVMYQWRDIVPTFETKITEIDNINLKHAQCDEVDSIYRISGDSRRPINNICLEDITVKSVRKNINSASEVTNLFTKDINIK